MTGLILQRGFTLGRQVWFIMVVACGLALGTQTSVARECHRETPLPAEVRLIAPGPQVPEAMARFAGVWSGVWDNTDDFCHTLVVEEVFANSYARITYSHGASVTLNIPLPGSYASLASYTLFIASDGVLYGRSTGPDGSRTDDVVRWRITSDGHFCRTWHVWGGRRERCSAMSWEGETFIFSSQDHFRKEAYRRIPSNPEGY